MPIEVKNNLKNREFLYRGKCSKCSWTGKPVSNRMKAEQELGRHEATHLKNKSSVTAHYGNSNLRSRK